MFGANKTDALEAGPPPAELRAALMPAVPLIVEAAISAIRTRGPDLGLSAKALERNLRLAASEAREPLVCISGGKRHGVR